MNRDERELLVAETKEKIFTTIGLCGILGICLVSLISGNIFYVHLFGRMLAFHLFGLSFTNIWVFILTVICIAFLIYGLLQGRKARKLQKSV